MEQEPVYVPSAKLVAACESALGRIYEIRQQDKEQLVRAMVDAYNQGVEARNHKRRHWIKWFGRAAEPYITPQGMELQIKAMLDRMPPEQAANEPIIKIHQQYGQLEHEAKDAMVMAKLTDAVPVSAGFCRGLSHLGIDIGAMRKVPFGFHPDKSK